MPDGYLVLAKLLLGTHFEKVFFERLRRSGAVFNEAKLMGGHVLSIICDGVDEFLAQAHGDGVPAGALVIPALGKEEYFRAVRLGRQFGPKPHRGTIGVRELNQLPGFRGGLRGGVRRRVRSSGKLLHGVGADVFFFPLLAFPRRGIFRLGGSGPGRGIPREDPTTENLVDVFPRREFPVNPLFSELGPETGSERLRISLAEVVVV